MYSMNRGSPPHDEVWLNFRGLFKRAGHLLTVQRPLRQWQTAKCAATQKTATCAEVAIFRKTTFETFLQNQQDGFNGGALIAVDC